MALVSGAAVPARVLRTGDASRLGFVSECDAVTMVATSTMAIDSLDVWNGH